MLDRIGKYEVRSQVGRGAMGTVYEGFDPSIGRRVAIKMLRTEVFEPSQLPDLLARFKREAQSAGRLSHPNIVTIHEYGEEAGAPYIVMEYIAGQEIGHHMNRGVRFSLEDIARIMAQLLGALAHAHEHGVVHRDLKPSNMFLLKDGSIKVVDFGIARVESSELTETGAMLGTPAYMSPEQCLGRRVDHRSDLFSAGVILYQLLTGDKPFTGSTTTIIQKVLRMDPLPPSELDPTLSPAWDQVIGSAMAKMPEARYQSAQEFADAVRGALGPVARAGRGADATEVMRTAVVPPKAEAPAAEPPAMPAAQPRRSSFWPVAVIVLLAAAAAGGYFALNRAPQPEPVAQAPVPPAADQAQVRREVEERLRREYEEKEAARRTAERIAAEKAAAERAAAQEAREKLAAERAAADKLAAERAAAAGLAAQRAEAERSAAAVKAAAERAAAEKAAAEKAAAARAAAERAAAERAAAERAAQEAAAATQAATAGAAAKDEDTEPPTPLDGAWAGTAKGPRQCPDATYKVTIKNGSVRGTAQWERSTRQHEVRGYVHDDSSAIFIVTTMEPRTPYSRFMLQLENGRLVGRETVTCTLGPYNVTVGRQ